MASLTPLSKGLIALAVVGGMASAVWHLALKERFAAPSAQPSPAGTATPGTPAAPTVSIDVAPTAPPPANATAPQASPEPAPARADTPVNPSATATAGLSAAENAERGRKALEAGDYAQARGHLERAVADGDGASACLLGEMTLKGQGGIAASQDKAAALFQLAQSRQIICFASAR